MEDVRAIIFDTRIKRKTYFGIESQNQDISELKTKRDNSLIEILKIKKRKQAVNFFLGKYYRKLC